MSILKFGRAAAWMSVAIMASLTPLFVLVRLIVLASTQMLTRLDPSLAAALVLTAGIIALAPWWSLVTMLVARQRV